MNKKTLIKKVLSIVICLGMLCSFSACNDKAKDTAQKIKSASTKAQPLTPEKNEAPVAVDYRSEKGELATAQVNPISFNIVDNEEGTVEYMTIYGLKDEGMADVINKRIAVFANTLAEASSEGQYVFVYDSWNCNDVISLYGIIVEPNSEDLAAIDQIIIDQQGLNIDLRDGSMLNLGDLFAEGFSTEEAFNLGNVGPNSFYLNENGINFIAEDNSISTFDYAIAGDNWLIADGCDPEIYLEPEKIGFSLVYHGTETTITEENSDNLGRDNIWMYKNLSYPADFPDALVSVARSELASMLPADDAVINLANANRGSWISGNYNVSCKILGNYYVITSECTHNVNADGIWSTYNNALVYDDTILGASAGVTAEDVKNYQLSLEDIFNASYDYESLFKSELANTWAVSYGNVGYKLDNADFTDESVDTLFEEASFYLTNEGICLQSMPHIISMGEGEDYYAYRSPIFVKINFGAIGQENLKVF